MPNLILNIDRPAYGGVSIGRHGGKIVLIRGAVLPGETVEVTNVNEKKDYFSASVSKILKPSADRIDPLCRHFGECGGCHFQHIPYSLQVQLKEEILRNCLRRQANIEVALSRSIINATAWNYRLRGQFKISRGKTGFYRANSRDVVSIDSCPLMGETLNRQLHRLKDLIHGLIIKEIYITSDDCSVALIKSPTHIRTGEAWNKGAAEFLESGFQGLCIETGDNRVLRYGKSYVTLGLGHLTYTVSPMSFLQSNWKMNTSVVTCIADTLGPLKGRRVLDLYAGAGNFSLPLAAHAEVVAVEENQFAVEDGKRNVKINQINNYKFIRSSAERFRPDNGFDVLLLDPPRKGLAKQVMNTVLSLLPEKIVYVSCNPATFARDLKKLHSRYSIDSVRMIDFFPQTYHIEALAFLRLR